MSIFETQYLRAKQDMSRTRKDYANGTGISGHRVYSTDNSIPIYSMSSGATLQTSQMWATYYDWSVFSFSWFNHSGSQMTITALKMPVVWWDWTSSDSGSISMWSPLSTYVDWQYVYFNYSWLNHMRYDMASNSWNWPNAWNVTTWSPITSSYTYNWRTYTPSGKILSSIWMYFFPLVQID